jgi:inositol 1,4,5-triphosphate receptor type 3
MYDILFNYYVLYFGISMLGLFSNEIFYCLHLLDVCNRFPTLQNVVRSVTDNYVQLAMTGMLLLIIMYIFTTISFFYLQDTDYDYFINPYDSDWIGEQRCQTIMQCFIMTLDKGISLDGGVGHYTESVHYKDEMQKFALKLGLDSSFHILVKVILLNILFGIIVDTFASMRESKKMMELDMNNFCFICHQGRFDFE